MEGSSTMLGTSEDDLDAHDAATRAEVERSANAKNRRAFMSKMIGWPSAEVKPRTPDLLT
jgi:hypothetical protein